MDGVGRSDQHDHELFEMGEIEPGRERSVSGEKRFEDDRQKAETGEDNDGRREQRFGCIAG